MDPNVRIEISKTIALSKYKVLCKKKNFTFGIKNTLIEAALSNSSYFIQTKHTFLKISTKNALLWYFKLEFEKICCQVFLPAPPNFSNGKVSCKNKQQKIWVQNCLIWMFLDCNFEKFLSYLKSAPLNLSNMSS